MFPNISLNRRMPNGTSGGVRGASNPSPYSITLDKQMFISK
jgi:hypothetical protein